MGKQNVRCVSCAPAALWVARNTPQQGEIMSKDVEYYKKEKKEWLSFLEIFTDELTLQDLRWVWLYVDRFDNIISRLQNPYPMHKQQVQQKLNRALARQVLIYGR
jgi:hypothetical protein